MKILKNNMKIKVENPSNIQLPLYQKKIKINDRFSLGIRELVKTYSCPSCPALFSRVAKLKLHAKIHLKEKMPNVEEGTFLDGLCESEKLPSDEKDSHQYNCQMCKSVFARKNSFHLHMKVHRKEKPFNCNECGATFVQSGHLNIHKRSHTGEKPYVCAVCQQGFKQISHLRSHEKIHTQTKPHTCKLCSAAFIQKSSLNRHIKIHTGEKPFTCEICLAKFGLKTNLLRHTASKHSENKLFSCTKCEATFFQSSDLKRHTFSHTGLKFYKCKDCEATFSRSNNLKYHIFTHTGEMPFECDKCPEKFANPRDLKKHRNIHQQSELYSCSNCSKKFHQHLSFERHMAKHAYKFSCLVCSASFMTKYSLKSHVSKHCNKNKRGESFAKALASEFDTVSSSNERKDSRENLVQIDNEPIIFSQTDINSRSAISQSPYLAYPLQRQNSNICHPVTVLYNENFNQLGFPFSASPTTVLPVVQSQLPALLIASSNHILQGTEASHCANKQSLVYAINSENNCHFASFPFSQVPSASATPILVTSNVSPVATNSLSQHENLDTYSAQLLYSSMPCTNIQTVPCTNLQLMSV